MKFKKGDIVVCILEKMSNHSGNYLVEKGKEYEISSTYMDGTRQMVYLVGDRFRGINLYAHRFQLTLGGRLNPILYRIKRMEERFNKRKSPCAV